MNSPRQSGLSLIELMVALALGGLLMLGLVQIFSASRASYSLAQGAARVQESSRLAVEYLQHDLRHAGHFGCASDQQHFQNGARGFRSLFLQNAGDYSSVPQTTNGEALRFDLSLFGYEANATSPGQAVSLSAVPVAGAPGDWTPSLPRMIADLEPKPVRGSDIVVLRRLSAESTALQAFKPDSTSPGRTMLTIDLAQWNMLVQYDVTRTAQDEFPGLFGIADCNSVLLFQVGRASSISGNKYSFFIGGGPLNQGQLEASDIFGIGQTRMHRAESFIYYVGLKNAGQNGRQGEPALYRARFNAYPGASEITVKSAELVDGIESLQLLYGLDASESAAQPPLGRVGKTVPANLVALNPSGLPEVDSTLTQRAWQRVGSVQVGMLVRSKEPASAGVRARRLSAQGTLFHPAADTRYRNVHEVTVALRNRLYGQ